MKDLLENKTENIPLRRFSDYEELRTGGHPLRRATDRIIQQASVLIASLEVVGDGVILLDSEARVSFSSQTANMILEKMKDFIWFSDNRLCFSSEINRKELNNTLKKIRLNKQNSPVSDVMVINRSESKRPIILSLCSLPSTTEDSGLMIIFRDPDMERTTQWEIFTRHFNLTVQEAKLSLALADGLSIQQYSDDFHISTHTARSHLKSIFAKTSTRRQSDLIRLIFTFTRL